MKIKLTNSALTFSKDALAVIEAVEKQSVPTFFDTQIGAEVKNVLKGIFLLENGDVAPIMYNTRYSIRSLKVINGVVTLTNENIGSTILPIRDSIKYSISLYNGSKKSDEPRIEDHIIFDDRKMNLATHAKEVLDLINKGERKYIDNHTNTEQDIHGYAILNKGEICPIYFGTHFCMNGMYVDSEDGRIHLSQVSAGGNMHIHDEHDLERATAVYNDSMLMEGGKIYHIANLNAEEVQEDEVKKYNLSQFGEEVMALFIDEYENNGRITYYNDMSERIEELLGLAVLSNGELAPLFINTFFSLSELYVKDGRVHLSNNISHGVIDTRRLVQSDIEFAINDYNERHDEIKIVDFKVGHDLYEGGKLVWC